MALSMTKLPLAEMVGMDTVKAPEPPVCVETIVLPSVSWFDVPVKVNVPNDKPPKVTSDVVSSA